MKKPTRYFVEYDDPQFWRDVERGKADRGDWEPDVHILQRDFTVFAAALSFARSLQALSRIWERFDIEDTTPPAEYCRGLLWNYEERMLVEEPHEWKRGDPWHYQTEERLP